MMATHAAAAAPCSAQPHLDVWSASQEAYHYHWNMPEAVPAISRDPLRILIVNGDMRSAGTLKDTLSGLGYSTTMVAYSGKRALATVATFSPSVVIVDLELEDMTGYRLARMMRAHVERQVRNVPLIAVAERQTFATEDLARAAGFVGVVTKPVRSGTLSQLLSLSRM